MTKRMLIDATHPEETRVVVLDGPRLEEFDVETSTKKQNKGNIYLARIVRVEPSLQAAFVDYGGNRHGFLAFSEIHPDYYQISDADRARLIAEQEELAKAENDEDDDPDTDTDTDTGADAVSGGAQADRADGEAADTAPVADEDSPEETGTEDGGPAADGAADPAERAGTMAEDAVSGPALTGDPETDEPPMEDGAENDNAEKGEGRTSRSRRRARPAQAAKPRGPSKTYKIQDVIKRRQIVLVQVVKEERGNKGAALTTYLSLAGRYCVFVPNTTRGGGVSRKITNASDRKRLKSIMAELSGPKGSAIILRTAGSERSKAEIKRDHDYLLRTWETIRETALTSRSPCLVHEEGALIKRAIRDIYSRDIEEVLVEGEEGYRAAKDFMRMLTPSHARRVQQYKDEQMPLFHRYQVENQMDAMLQPVAQLKSGGYLVINQTEALVAIDVNSGRSTRERNIDDTAYKTNLEAADEIARQLRLRDLAGLIVIDFIDMDDPKANAAVERCLKEALKSDRARIQVGHISTFGLLEMSRQRLRPSLMETSFRVCSHCRGTGMVRSVESTALHILRVIEEDGIRRKYGQVTVFVPTTVALYILNRKRDVLADIEQKYDLRVFLEGDDTLLIPDFRIDRVKLEAAGRPAEAAPPVVAATVTPAAEEPREDEAVETETGRPEDHEGEDRSGGRKRRRRRRRRRGDAAEGLETADALEASEAAEGPDAPETADARDLLLDEDVDASPVIATGAEPDEAAAPVVDGEDRPEVVDVEPVIEAPLQAEDTDQPGQAADIIVMQDLVAEPGPGRAETAEEPVDPGAATPPESEEPPVPRRMGWWSR